MLSALVRDKQTTRWLEQQNPEDLN